MSFSFKIVSPASETSSPCSGDDLVSFAIDGAALLERCGFEFAVSGFGDPRWPTDVGYDLSVLLSQIPDVLSSIRAGRPITLEFAGQGVERNVDLTPEGSDLVLRCRSGTIWEPDPIEERLDRSTFEARLVELAEEFVQAVAHHNPRLAESDGALELVKSL